MRSIVLPVFENPEKNTAGNIEEISHLARLEQPRRWVALILPVFALLLWLLAGSLLTWLLADFNRALAPVESSIAPWLVSSLFVATTVAVGWLSLRSWKRGAPTPGVSEKAKWVCRYARDKGSGRQAAASPKGMLQGS